MTRVASSCCFSFPFQVVDTEDFDERDLDTVIICAGTQVQPSSAGLLAFVRRAVQTARRVAAPCTGAFVLAEAGVLDGRRASTHWLFARQLQRQFPLIKVEADRIFIVDGNLWTSAGMTAAVDLALALVEKDQARLLIEQARLPLDRIAVETGFADRERMRRAFLRCLGQPPQAIRRNARAGLDH
ncbi:MAG TPA: DJ-1/PfpI family protein [Pseudomonas sp.]|nr:DJ-1/PfpI family protein [Pseudomonas sp.]